MAVNPLMLNSLRKNTKVVVWSVVVAFALWGGYSVSSQMRKESMYAGKVFGKNVSFQEFNRFYRSGQLFNLRKEAADDPQIIRETAWQGVIFSREAKRRKVEVSDEEVRKEIHQLLESNKVNPENYESWLERVLRETPKTFEIMVREVLRIQKFMKLLQDSVPVPPVSEEDALARYMEENNNITLELVPFSDSKEAETFRKSIQKNEDWEKAVEPHRNDLRQVGPLPVNVLPAVIQITPEQAQELHKMGKGAVSQPLQAGQNFFVIHVLDTKTADEKQFQTDKKAYIDVLNERGKEKGLLDKSREIINQANLQDYHAASASAPQ
jgi:hypothetical protein